MERHLETHNFEKKTGFCDRCNLSWAGFTHHYEALGENIYNSFYLWPHFARYQKISFILRFRIWLAYFSSFLVGKTIIGHGRLSIYFSYIVYTEKRNVYL